MFLDCNNYAKMKPGRAPSIPKRRPTNLEKLLDSFHRTYNETIDESLQKQKYNFVVTDPRLPDHPIVFASEGFLRMSGYNRDEVIGRNCRFLQGPGTDRSAVLEIRDAVREERPCQVRVLNYTKQGRAFWNLFYMAPIYSKESGVVIHYVGVQTPVANANLACGASLRREQVVLDSPVSLRLRGGAADAMRSDPEQIDNEDDDDDDDEVSSCTVISDVLKEKAALALREVTSELTLSSRIKGNLSQTRAAERAATGVVCSSLMITLTRIQQSFVLSDPSLPDTPIVYASDAFCNLTGYSREEVVGRNCRFLQGPDTNPEDVQKIRRAVEEEQACTVRILNYRKDETPFYNNLHVAPVRSCDGKVAFFAGVQLEAGAVDTNTSQETGMSAHAKQLGAVGVARVAVRSLQGSGLRRTLKRTIL